MDSLPPRYQEPSASEGSDEDSLFGSQSNPPSSPEGRNGGEGEQPQPTVSNEPYGGLFGDDGDDEDDQDLPDDATTTGKANRKVGPAESYSTNVVQPPDPSTIKILKLSNMININKQAFNPLTHEPGPAVLVDDFGHRRINLHHLNTVRWRWVTDPSTGERTLQSNARFVRWEDGSMTLHIGEEVLSVAEVQDTAARRYMYVRVNKLMQVCGCRGIICWGVDPPLPRPPLFLGACTCPHTQPQMLLTTRLQLHPASLSSKLHRAIQMKSVQQSTKQVRVRTTAASVDKNRQEEEAKMRELHRSRCGLFLCVQMESMHDAAWTGSSSSASKSASGTSTAAQQGAWLPNTVCTAE